MRDCSRSFVLENCLKAEYMRDGVKRGPRVALAKFVAKSFWHKRWRGDSQQRRQVGIQRRRIHLKPSKITTETSTLSLYISHTRIGRFIPRLRHRRTRPGTSSRTNRTPQPLRALRPQSLTKRLTYRRMTCKCLSLRKNNRDIDQSGTRSSPTSSRMPVCTKRWAGSRTTCSP